MVFFAVVRALEAVGVCFLLRADLDFEGDLRALEVCEVEGLEEEDLLENLLEGLLERLLEPLVPPARCFSAMSSVAVGLLFDTEMRMQ